MKKFEAIENYLNVANFITAAQIYLQDNFLLEKPLESSHIKPRLLGHWGTCPGINFVYAHLNNIIRETGKDFIFVLGPGHGFPALQANLFLEGSLEKYYPQATRDFDGLKFITKNFSWPYGFPSHSNPGTPGVILEGGELGYSLATAYGAVLDNPELIAACLIGDGEAETGTLATSWNLNKLTSPKENGVVLPIVHLNGYKISGPTILGRMSYVEITNYFSGLGYYPIIVELIAGEDIHRRMNEALNKSIELISAIKQRAKETTNFTPNFPVIILKTPKGWGTIKTFKGEKIEGNSLSHQVVLKDAKTDNEQLLLLEEWLRNYEIHKYFSSSNGVSEEILSIIPDESLRMGTSKYIDLTGKNIELKLPEAAKHCEEVPKRGYIGSSSMRRSGEYLNELIQLNNNFRIFSPDETYSNKLDKVFESTKRTFTWPLMQWDKDFGKEGKVIEMLSENTLFGLLQGYALTGRTGLFASYEAFVEIIASMADQYIKFLKAAREYHWRWDLPSVNLILTSSGWRQDHNGFSHQNPGFISGLLQKHNEAVKIYAPVDGNTTLFTLEKMFRSKNSFNVLVAGKTQEPRWLDANEANQLVKNGYYVFPEYNPNNFDLLLLGIGDYVSTEVIKSIEVIKSEMPSLKTKLIIINEVNKINSQNILFDLDRNKPTIINFHGYPDAIRALLFGKTSNKNIRINGYTENGSTTTPFDMHVRNGTDRFSIFLDILNLLFMNNAIIRQDFDLLTHKYQDVLKKHKNFIIKEGLDPEWV